jgi:hypothetical protein
LTGVGTPQKAREPEKDAQVHAETETETETERGGSLASGWAETNKSVRKLRKR